MNDDDMSNTFVTEVGQKSAIFKDDSVETLDEEESNSIFPEVMIDPPNESSNQNNNDIANNSNIISTNKELTKRKKQKKNHPFLPFLLMIICTSIGACGCYYYINYYSKDDKPIAKEENIKEEQTAKIEQLQPTSSFIVQLINRYYGDINQLDTYIELYSNKKTTNNDLSIDYKKRIAITNLNSISSIQSEQLQTSINMLFGTNDILNEKENIKLSKCYIYEYNSNDDIYELNVQSNCRESISYYLKTKIVKATKNLETNDINIYVAVALTDGNKVYKAYDEVSNEAKDEITNLTADSLDMDKDYVSFNQYNFLFKYDKENYNYYLDSIELNK